MGIIKGKWGLISEILSSRNSKVAYLAGVIFNELPDKFTSWQISDGKVLRFPYQEIRRKLGLKEKGDKAVWKNKSLAMIGEQLDVALITGELYNYDKKGQGKLEVKIVLRLEKDGLILEEIESVIVLK